MSENLSKGWLVERVEVLEKGIRVTFATERGRQDFVTSKFGIGRRGAKAAALAKFVTKSGLIDDVMAAYRFIRQLPRDYRGPLLFTPVIEDEEPRLSLVS